MKIVSSPASMQTGLGFPVKYSSSGRHKRQSQAKTTFLRDGNSARHNELSGLMLGGLSEARPDVGARVEVAIRGGARRPLRPLKQ